MGAEAPSTFTRCFGGAKAERNKGLRRLWVATGGVDGEGRFEYSWPWRLAPE